MENEISGFWKISQAMYLRAGKTYGKRKIKFKAPLILASGLFLILNKELP